MASNIYGHAVFKSGSFSAEGHSVAVNRYVNISNTGGRLTVSFKINTVHHRNIAAAVISGGVCVREIVSYNLAAKWTKLKVEGFHISDKLCLCTVNLYISVNGF